MSKQSLVAFWHHGRPEARQKSETQETATSFKWRLALLLLLALAILVAIVADLLQITSNRAGT